MTAHYITLWAGTCNDMRDNNAFSIQIMSILKAINTLLKGRMINRVLHLWSFHMKFIKLPKGWLDKFHMK